MSSHSMKTRSKSLIESEHPPLPPALPPRKHKKIEEGWAVWAKLNEDALWWPARIVNERDMDKYNRVGQQGESNIHVRLFDNEGTRVSLRPGQVCEYSANMSKVLQNGEVLDSMICACDEAHKFIEEKGIYEQQQDYSKNEFFQDYVRRMRGEVDSKDRDDDED